MLRISSAVAAVALLVVFAGAARAAAPEVTGATFPASVNADGEYANGEGTGEYTPISISGDGRYIAFESASTNLGAAGPAGTVEGFIKDLDSGAVALVTRADGSDGEPAGEPGIEDLKLSTSGRYVLFTSEATNLGPVLPGEAAGESHVYRRDLWTGETILVDCVSGVGGAVLSRSARAGGISADGRYVLFAANVADLEDPSGDHAETGFPTQYVRDTVTGTTVAVSRADGAAGALADESSEATSVSPDGRYVAFASAATNLNASANGEPQVYLRDLENGTTTLVSQNALAAIGDRGSGIPALVGAGGCEVQFSSLAFNLLEPSPQPVSGEQLYLADYCVEPPTLTLVSEEDGDLAGLAYGSWGTSDDGNLVLFGGSFSISGAFHLFLKDLESGEVSQIDRASGAGPSADGEPQQAAISANGCRAAFGSQATNLSATAPPEGPGGEKPFEVYVRQLSPCVEMPAKESDGGTPTPKGDALRAQSPVTVAAGAATLRIARLSARRLTLDLSGPGAVSIRVRRLVLAPRRHWRAVRALTVSIATAGRVEVPLGGLPAGRYRLNVRLRHSEQPGLVRMLAVAPPGPSGRARHRFERRRPRLANTLPGPQRSSMEADFD